MQVISDAKELEKHTYIKTRNPNIFPKKERLGLAQRMMNEASDLVADLMEANDLLLTDPQERELRYRAQRSALRNCRKLIHHIELAHEILSGLGDDAFAHWSRMAAGVKNQTAKWYKSDKERGRQDGRAGASPIGSPWGTPCFFVPGRPTTPATSGTMAR